MSVNVLMHSAHTTTHEELLAATSLASAPPILTVQEVFP
jgi:hypothetical protein